MGNRDKMENLNKTEELNQMENLTGWRTLIEEKTNKTGKLWLNRKL